MPLPDSHGLPGPRSTRLTADPGRTLAAALGRDCGEFGAPYACVVGDVVRVGRLGAQPPSRRSPTPGSMVCAVRGTSGISAGLLPLPMIRRTPLPTFDYGARTAQAASSPS